jgi:predicted nucleic-acid-binding Zn-ribbon protein
MRSGTCPKCQSNAVFFSDAEGLQAPIKASSGALLLNIYKDGKWVPAITLLTVDVYVCQNCGYLETYAHEPEKLEKLTESSNWRRVK